MYEHTFVSGMEADLMKNAIFFILDDYADWEFGYLASQLNQSKNWLVKTASTQSLVMSIGGFKTQVDYTIDKFPTSVDLLD